jgi:predicted tellurium resistance membrane protein TerC
MFEWIADPQAWATLATLALLEIVLGIDNIIFITILTGRLPAEQRRKAMTMGLGLAMLTRIGLLFSLAWIMSMTKPLFVVLAQEISARDLLLIVGGLFLLAKSTIEIHNSLEAESHVEIKSKTGGFIAVLIQIAIIDIIFSLDSVITAVGLARYLSVMVVAIVVAVCVMMFAAQAVSGFIDKHPSLKMLALSFLVLIGTALMAEGFDVHVPKGYIYFAMAFSVMVEMLNIRMRRKVAAPVKLHRVRTGEVE